MLRLGPAGKMNPDVHSDPCVFVVRNSEDGQWDRVHGEEPAGGAAAAASIRGSVLVQRCFME